MFGVLHALQIKLCQYKRQQGADAASAMTYRVFLGTKPMKKTNDI